MTRIVLIDQTFIPHNLPGRVRTYFLRVWQGSTGSCIMGYLLTVEAK